MPEGEYALGSTILQQRDGICQNRDGILAGSCLLPDRGLRKLWAWLGPAGANLSLPEVVGMTAAVPAEFLELAGKGKIAPGADADLVLLDERWRVRKTWVKGKLIFDAESGPNGSRV
jgi:N-acetylglucosamine-6-phosphate deacetylase